VGWSDSSFCCWWRRRNYFKSWRTEWNEHYYCRNCDGRHRRIRSFGNWIDYFGRRRRSRWLFWSWR
jgi:hypothetical protein